MYKQDLALNNQNWLIFHKTNFKVSNTKIIIEMKILEIKKNTSTPGIIPLVQTFEHTEIVNKMNIYADPTL